MKWCCTGQDWTLCCCILSFLSLPSLVGCRGGSQAWGESTYNLATIRTMMWWLCTELRQGAPNDLLPTDWLWTKVLVRMQKEGCWEIDKEYFSMVFHPLRKKATTHQVTTMLATSKKMSYFQVITTCLPRVLMTLHFNYHPSTISTGG